MGQREKRIEDYLHLYFGGACEIDNGLAVIESTIKGVTLNNMDDWKIKPILRPLSDMKNQEMEELLAILFLVNDNEDHPEVSKTDMFYWDDSTMVDGDIQVGALISYGRFKGQIAIRECGSVFFYDENGNFNRIENQPKGFVFLLSKGFDIFGLIKSGIALDSTSNKDPK